MAAGGDGADAEGAAPVDALAPGRDEVAGGVELLDPVLEDVAVVGDARRVAGDGVGLAAELASQGARGAGLTAGGDGADAEGAAPVHTLAPGPSPGSVRGLAGGRRDEHADQRCQQT